MSSLNINSLKEYRGSLTRVLNNISSKIEDKLSSQNECCICYDGRNDTVVLPCRHQICCSKCCDDIDECPICRVRIQQRIKTYY